METNPGDLGGEGACAAHLVDESGRLEPDVATFTVAPEPPYRLDLTAWALRRRPGNVVDRWEPERSAYLRVFQTSNGPVEVEVTQSGPPEQPELVVRLRGRGADLLSTRHEVDTTLRRSLGTDVELSGFYEAADRDPSLGPLAERFRGVRPPRFHTWTEALTSAVSCQQLSLAVGVTLLNRLAERYGSRGASGSPAFPTSAQLAPVPPQELRALGYSNRKAEVITDIAHGIESGSLVLDELVEADSATVVQRLCELRGIGRWSAEYVLLRGLGRLDVFPGDDVGAQNKLRRMLGIETRLDHASVGELLQRWGPYAGMVYFHLLLDGMADAGLVRPSA